MLKVTFVHSANSRVNKRLTLKNRRVILDPYTKSDIA